MTFKILNITTGEEKVFHSHNTGGIGCIEVHNNKKFFAVGEKGDNPSIYIYSYPELKIEKILENGTEKGFSCISFSKSGTKLASVGNDPDYSLVIWDW